MNELTDEQINEIFEACKNIRDMKEFAIKVKSIEEKVEYVEKDIQRNQADIKEIEGDVKRNKSKIGKSFITIEVWKNKMFEKIEIITQNVNDFIIETKNKVNDIKLDVNKQINGWMWKLVAIIVFGFISLFIGKWFGIL